jgi:hypothetical protein
MPKTQMSFRKFSARYFACTAGLWLLIVTAYAIWAFLIPHDFTFGPDIGPVASFVFFVTFYSIPYAVMALAFYLLFASAHSDGGGS